jgi:BolA protein
MSTQFSVPSRLARLEQTIQSHFEVCYLEIENQSAQHAGHYQGDGETHWSLLLVAKNFSGLSRIQRHQQVNNLFKDEFDAGLHALVLQLYSPEEWETKKQAHFQVQSS